MVNEIKKVMMSIIMTWEREGKGTKFTNLEMYREIEKVINRKLNKREKMSVGNWLRYHAVVVNATPIKKKGAKEITYVLPLTKYRFPRKKSSR